VPGGVGERFLHDAVGGEIDAGRQLPPVAMLAQPGLKAGPADGGQKIIELTEARTWCPRREVVI
jgi:hypothetical protein